MSRKAKKLHMIAAVALVAIGLSGCNLAPAPLAPVMCAAVDSVDGAICTAFAGYGQGVVDQAFRVARCESGLNPMAVSPNGYYQGLFQLGAHIVAIHAYGGDRLDAWQNSQAARDLYVSRGNSWSAWSCRP